MEENLDLIYETVTKLVNEADQMLLDCITKKKSITEKSSSIDLVTETDKKIEDHLITSLAKQYPEHRFIGEERTELNEGLTDRPTWIIDPIDGTMNFVHGFPHCCISIAFYRNKRAEIAIISCPCLSQRFSARRGHGAFLNDRPIRVSQTHNLNEALVACEMGSSNDPGKLENVRKNFETLMPLCHGLRSIGSCALNMAMVAMGATDAYYEFGIHVWDIAAGALLVEEAGGVVLDPCGTPINLLARRVLCASTQHLADQLVANLHQFYPLPTD